jgi:hypothetical protein
MLKCRGFADLHVPNAAGRALEPIISTRVPDLAVASARTQALRQLRCSFAEATSILSLNGSEVGPEMRHLWINCG